MKFRPIEIAVGDRLSPQSRERLERAWLKALDRTDTDPDGAVTAARSFLESTCKHVLDTLGVTYGPNLDLLQQFRLVADELKISAAGSTGRIEKQFYTGAYSVVQALTELRNEAGDAHGKSQEGTRSSSAQGEFAVNLAGSTAAFLLRKLDSHLAATRRLTSKGNAVLRFDKAVVWRLVDHAQNAPDHMTRLRERKPKPSIWLVADAGIYLKSNGKPALLANGRLAKDDADGKPRLTAHADGCGPFDAVDDWSPLQVAMSGGDDFCEPLSVAQVRRALEGAAHQIVVVSNATHYSIYSDMEFDDMGGEATLE
ncbi:abortive infection family protein [Caulobacter sp. DWP3-1-3b2]|uniref:abortive infection family protein n=1 Tax=Caulobacter sp. DWP3-1-3b2 TaxID=2804643 RepID=UPI003CF0244B